MNYYWVNVGRSHKEVLDGGFVWAPQPYKNEKGKRVANAGWKHVANINAGDWLFFNKDQRVIYVGIACSDSFPSKRPPSREFNKWKDEGNRANVQILRLEEPIPTSDFVEEFFVGFDQHSDPVVLTHDLTFCQRYCCKLSQPGGEFVFKQLPKDAQNWLKKTSEKQRLEDYTSYPFPYQSEGDSWVLMDEHTAVKTVDKTVCKELKTCVPKDIIRFFCGRELTHGEQVNLVVYLDGPPTEVELLRRPDGRNNLKLNSLKSVLNLKDLSIGNDKIWFERDDRNPQSFHVYIQSRNNKHARPPKASGLSRPFNTSSNASIRTRRGQAFFKTMVSNECNGVCVVTGVADGKPSILIASHIKPWRVASDAERMDGHNGLLLAPHVDKLFDNHLISFDEAGQILVSKALDENIIKAWGIDTKKKYPLSSQNQKYMRHHREAFEQLQSDILKGTSS